MELGPAGPWESGRDVLPDAGRARSGRTRRTRRLESTRLKFTVLAALMHLLGHELRSARVARRLRRLYYGRVTGQDAVRDAVELGHPWLARGAEERARWRVERVGVRRNGHGSVAAT